MTLDALIDALSSSDLERARPAAEALTRMACDPEQQQALREPLLALAKDPGARPHARAFAVLQTRRLLDAEEGECWKLWAALAKDPDALVRRAAARVVSDWDDLESKIGDILWPLLKDVDEAVRLEAVLGLTVQLISAAVPTLLARIARRDPGPAVFPFPARDDRLACLHAAESAGSEEMIEPARRLLADPEETEQIHLHAAAILASAGDEEGKRLFVDAMGKRQVLRGLAFELLDRVGLDDSREERLLQILCDRADPMRGEAARQLGEFCVSDALAPLQAMLDDASEPPENRRAAATALAAIDEDEAWDALQQSRQRVGDAALQEAIAELLAKHLEEEIDE